MTKDSAIKVVARNRKAGFEYELVDRFEAGLELRGSEVKSLRAGKAHLEEAWVKIQDGEAFLMKANIAPYAPASFEDHVPDRPRRLLLHKAELLKLQRAIKEKGLTIVALSLYFKGPRAKVEIATGRGKKLHDKRESIRVKDEKREKARMGAARR